MPEIVDELVTAKMVLMSANYRAVHHHDDPVGVCSHRNRFADSHGIDAIAITVKADQQLR